MADSKSFLVTKECSSHSSDLELPLEHSPPTQATSQGDHYSSSSVLAFGPAHAESNVERDRTPSPVPKPTTHSEPVSHPEQDSQPVGQLGNRYVYTNPPPGPHENIKDCHNDDSTADQTLPNGKNKRMMVLFAILLLVLLGFVLSGIVGEVGIIYWLPKENELQTNFKVADLMPNDTILLYQGNSSSITISEVLPMSQKPDASLFVTECTELIQHTKNQSLTDRPFNFTGSSPVFIPTNPLHYEQGSAIMFTITTVKATENSTLDLLIFDNVTKATEYSHNPSPETGAQAIRQWKIDTKQRDNSTHITFMPSYGGYFIPVLSPVPSPILDIELSYMIKQVFYFHGDYAQYSNCSLVEPCSLHFSTGNESCVLAYIPPLSEKVTLQTKAVIGEKEHANENLLLLRALIGGIIGGVAIILIVALVASICMCRKNKPPQQGYTQLGIMTTAK